MKQPREGQGSGDKISSCRMGSIALPGKMESCLHTCRAVRVVRTSGRPWPWLVARGLLDKKVTRRRMRRIRPREPSAFPAVDNQAASWC